MGDPKTVQVGEFRENLSTLLKEVEQGVELLVMSRKKPVARVIPAAPAAKRRFGLMKGRIWMAPDFDETPADLIAAMEGDEEP